MISSLLAKLKKAEARLFPERQFYFRANGIVRFIPISRNQQILASLMLLALVMWSVTTSYNFIFNDEILAEKNRKLVEAEQKYTLTSLQFEQLKKDIQESTKALEQRQLYLEQLLDEDKAFTTTLPQNEAATLEKTPEQIEPLSLQIKIPTDNLKISQQISKRQKQLDRLYFDISRIKKQQQNMAAAMIDRISHKISYVENTLKKSGIKSQKLIQFTKKDSTESIGMGGPFIFYADGQDQNVLNPDTMAGEPFVQLYARYSHLSDLEAAIQHIPIGKPARKYYISSGFGVRKDPFKKTWARHHGLDMAGWWKTPIYATADGVIVKAGYNGAYGKFIEIDHGNGFRSRYGHLSRLEVKKGDIVTLDQQIGLMGSTGRSTSPHLHYEIWFNGKPINPQKIFKASDHVLKIQRQDYDS